MFWLILLGAFAVAFVLAGFAWHSVDRIGTSHLPLWLKIIIIAAILAALFCFKLVL